MYLNRSLNNRISSLHEWALRLVHNDFKSSFHQFLDNSAIIHQRNLQSLATEIFKVHNSIAPEVTKDIFEIKNHRYDFEEMGVSTVEM